MSEGIIDRQSEFTRFLKNNDIPFENVVALKGDASRRRFYRVQSTPQKSLIIIDADPSQGEEPSAYAAVTGLLRKHKLNAPEIFAQDIERGFFIVADFGDELFANLIQAVPSASVELYQNALELLIDIQKITFDSVLSYGDGTYKLPEYDMHRLTSEAKIFTDWYFPKITKRPTPTTAKDELTNIMRGLLLPVINQASCLVLRDYHAENLMMLSGKKGKEAIGLLDFQDAVIGNPAYDVVSLLQDARRDVSSDFEKSMLDFYMKKANIKDTQAFIRDYTILGAQRNIKILGIFARLWIRDRKDGYLKHLTRVWNYLDKDLSASELKPLKEWFDRWLPVTIRYEKIEA